MATFNYKQDAVQLAKEVIALYNQGKIEDAKSLCNDKILDLAKIYKPSTLCKGIQLTYRKAIFSESGLSEYRYTEYPVSLFSVPIEMIAATNETTRDTVEKQLNDYIFIKSESIDKMLKKAVELIKKDCISGQDYYDKAVGIALLTGRRIYSEVLLQADFEAINSNKISFTGQAKGGVEKSLESYKIPVLGCDSKLIIKALEDVQNYIKNRDWFDSLESEKQLSDKTKKPIERAVFQNFTTILKDEKILLTPHDLRKVYATVCWYRLTRCKGSFTAYAATLLGHSYQSKVSGKIRPDTKTAESYDKFRITE